MRSTTMLALLAVMLTAGMFATTAEAQAAANERIRFQGRLLDSSSNPITIATDVEFNLYLSPTGGTSVWSETHTVTPSADGVFSIELGDQSDFSGVDFSQALYLGVTPETDPEMTPRFLFTASSVAHYANDAGSLGGLDSSDFAQLGASNVNFTGSVSAGSFSGDGSGLTGLNASSLTGALPALDGSALTSLNASSLTGSLPGIDGSSLTGLTAGQISGLGSLAGQDGSNVSITGGSIDGTTIGGTTPAAGTFTSLTGGTTNLSSGGVTLTVATTGTQALDVLGTAEIAGSLDVGGPITTLAPITTGGPVNITSPAPVIFNQGAANAGSLMSGATANRVWTLPDADGTLALTSDITGGTQDGDFNSLNVVNTGTFGGLLSANDGLSASLTATGVPTTPIVGGHLTTSSDGTETYGALGEATYTGTAIATGEQIIGSHGMAHISNSGAGILAIGSGGQSTEVQLGDNLGVHAWARQGGRNTGLMAVANADFTQQTTWSTGLPSNLSAAVLGFNNESGANDYGLYVESANNFIDGDLEVSGTINASISGTAADSDLLDGLDSTDFAILAAGSNTFAGDITANSFSGDGGSLTNLTAVNLTGPLPGIDGSALTGLTAGQIGGLGTMATENAGDYTLTANLGSMAFEDALDYYTSVETDTQINSSITALNLDTMSQENAANYTPTANLGSMAFEDALDYYTAVQTDTEISNEIAALNLGSMSTQDASAVAITGGSGDFTSLTSATGFTSTGGESSFTSPQVTPGATYTAHDFVASVNGNGGNTSRALRVDMTGTGSGSGEVTGAWLTASGDGDITQGVFGQSNYTGAGGGTSIGLDGRARIFSSTAPHLAIGTAGRADDSQTGSNIGVHAWAANGGQSAGLMAVANADQSQQDTWGGGLPTNLTAAVLGFNNQTGTDDYGLYVEGTNNRIIGDLTVTGMINATITGSVAADNITDGNMTLSTGNITLTGGTFTGNGSGLTGVDADLLNNQAGSFYLDLGNHSGTLPDASLTGTYSNAVTFSNGTFIGDGTGLSGVNAVSLNGFDQTDFAATLHSHDAADVNSGTFADGRISASSVTQHESLLSLGAGQIASGTFADARIGESNVTQHEGALSIASTQVTGLGDMALQNSSNVAITGGSGDFSSLTSAGGFSSTGGDSSFTTSTTTTAADYAGHVFDTTVNNPGDFLSTGIEASITGTGVGTTAKEVSGARIHALSDGENVQGVYGSADYSGGGAGSWAIGVEGEALVSAGGGTSAIGTLGRSTSTQGGGNTGVLAFAEGGATNAGLYAAASSLTQLENHAGTVTTGGLTSAAMLGYNPNANAGDYGLHVTAQNNRIDGDLEVTGNINATITGSVAADNITDGNLTLTNGNIDLTNGTFSGNGSGLTGVDADLLGGTVAGDYALSANVLSLSGGTMTGDIVFAGSQTFDGSAVSGAVDNATQAANAALLENQSGAFYRNADNINAGVLDPAHLNGIYGISITGNAATADSALSADDSGTLGGQLPAFYRDASNINAGTLADTHLSPNVALLDAPNNTFTGDLSAATLTSLGGVDIGGASTLTASSATNQNAFDLDITIDNDNSAGDIAGELGQGLNVKASTGDVTDQRAIALRGRLVDNFAGNTQARQLRGVNGVVNTDGGDQTSVLGGYFYTRARTTTTNGVASLTGAAADAEVQVGAGGFTNTQRLTGGRFGVSDLEGVDASAAGVVGTVISDGSWTGTTASANTRTGSSTGVFGLATGSATSNVGVFGAANAGETDVVGVANTTPNAGVYALNPDVTDTQWALVADGRANVLTDFDSSATGTPTGLVATVTGTGMGTSAANEVTGARISSISDGDSLQGLYGRAEYTAAASSGTWAIGIEGDSVVNDAGSGISAVGTVGRATSAQAGDNTGVLAFADGGASNAGLYAAAATQGQLETHAGGLGAISAAILGYNPDSTASDYGLHVTAQNNRIDGDLEVTGNINATITGSVAADNITDGNLNLSTGNITLTSGTFTGNGSGLTSLTAANLTGPLPGIDGSALTGLTAGQIGGLGTMATENAGDYTLTANLGSMAFENALDYYTSVETDTQINSSITALNLDTMSQENAADYYTAAQTDTEISNEIAALNLGTMSTQDASAVAITGGSGDFGSLTSAGGFSSTGGDSSFTTSATATIADYAGHVFDTTVSNPGDFLSTGFEASITGTGVSTTAKEVSGARIHADSDGETVQGVYGSADYSGGGAGSWAIGVEGEALVSAGGGTSAIGTLGRATGTNGGGNTGVLAFAESGDTNAGLFAIVGDDSDAGSHGQALAGGTFNSAAVLGYNPLNSSDDYGLHVTAQNNFIDGDLNVSGILTGDGSGITGVTADSIDAVDINGSLSDGQVDNNLTIDGGSVSNTVIGASGAAAGTFTDLTVNTSLSLPSNSIADSALSSSVTLAGNAFNGANQLVELDGSSALPAVDGSALTGVDAATLDGTAANAYALSANVLSRSGGTMTGDINMNSNDITNAGTITAGSFDGDGTNVTGVDAVTLNGAGNSAFATASHTHSFADMFDALDPDQLVGTYTEAVTLDNTSNVYNGLEITLGTPGTSGTTGDLQVYDSNGLRTFRAHGPRISLGAENHRAFVNFYSDNTEFGTMMAPAGMTANHDWTLPDATGTIALTSDIPNVSGVYLELAGGTMTGAIDMDANNIDNAGSITATNFIGEGSGLTSLTAANLTGPLPGIDGSALTDLTAGQIDGELTDTQVSDTLTVGSGSSVADAALSGNVTLAGNTFNGNSQLVQLTGSGALPTVDGSNLTGLTTGQISGLGSMAFESTTSYYTTAETDNEISGAITALNLESMSTQDAGNVAITGGNVNDTIIGGSTAAAGTFTSLTANGLLTANDGMDVTGPSSLTATSTPSANAMHLNVTLDGDNTAGNVSGEQGQGLNVHATANDSISRGVALRGRISHNTPLTTGTTSDPSRLHSVVGAVTTAGGNSDTDQTMSVAGGYFNAKAENATNGVPFMSGVAADASISSGGTGVTMHPGQILAGGRFGADATGAGPAGAVGVFGTALHTDTRTGSNTGVLGWAAGQSPSSTGVFGASNASQSQLETLQGELITNSTSAGIYAYNPDQGNNDGQWALFATGRSNVEAAFDSGATAGRPTALTVNATGNGTAGNEVSGARISSVSDSDSLEGIYGLADYSGATGLNPNKWAIGVEGESIVSAGGQMRAIGMLGSATSTQSGTNSGVVAWAREGSSNAGLYAVANDDQAGLFTHAATITGAGFESAAILGHNPEGTANNYGLHVTAQNNHISGGLEVGELRGAGTGQGDRYAEKITFDGTNNATQTISNTRVSTDSIVVATVESDGSSTPVSIETVEPGTDQITVTFSGSVGGSNTVTINYVIVNP